MSKGTLLYAQSGGVTAVINASASAVIETAREHGVPVLAARFGILGALREELVDTSGLDLNQIRALAHTPGGAFGSCRVKLKSLEDDRARYERLLAVFRAHDVRWFLYNGGNDSADTALKVSRQAASSGYAQPGPQAARPSGRCAPASSCGSAPREERRREVPRPRAARLR